jgi:hypothetical protein
MMKLRTLRWAAHVARMGKRRGVYRIWVRKLSRPGVCGRIILKCTLQKWDGGMAWMDMA